MRILICGDRHWWKERPIREVLSWFDPQNDVLIHGGAAGADSMSGYVAQKEFNWKEENIVVYPAEWTKFGKRAGPIRNRQMITEGKPDIVFAFHSNILLSKGTRDMMKACCYADVPVLLYE